MCISCYLTFSDDEIVRQFEYALSFEKWNDCALDHILIAVSGASGDKARDMAIQLYDRFVAQNSKEQEMYRRVINEIVPASRKFTKEEIRQQWTSNGEIPRMMATLLTSPKNI